MKEKNESCVELNIYVECDKCRKHESHDPKTPCEGHEKKDDDDKCVTINVFVDCGDKKKCSYTF